MNTELLKTITDSRVAAILASRINRVAGLAPASLDELRGLRVGPRRSDICWQHSTWFGRWNGYGSSRVRRPKTTPPQSYREEKVLRWGRWKRRRASASTTPQKLIRQSASTQGFLILICFALAKSFDAPYTVGARQRLPPSKDPDNLWNMASVGLIPYSSAICSRRDCRSAFLDLEDVTCVTGGDWELDVEHISQMACIRLNVSCETSPEKVEASIMKMSALSSLVDLKRDRIF